MGQETHQVVKLAKVVSTPVAPNKHQVYERIALFKEDGTPIDLTPAAASTGANVPMTGYAGHAAGNVAAADKVNDAIGKLEARIAALEAA